MLNNQQIPWARIAAESVAIVASILVAFAIDAWWEDRRERHEEQDYLVSLRQEFISALTELESWDNITAEIDKAHEDLLDQIHGADRASEESLYYMFSLLSRPTQVSLPQAVFGDLISTGGTQLIRSDQLRIALAEYGAGLSRLAPGNDAAWATWEQRIQPLLEGRVPRVNRLLLGSFGRNQRQVGIEIPFGQSPHKPDFEGVLADPVFEDVVAERWLRVENRLNDVRELKELVEEIIIMIDKELGPGGNRP